MRLIHSTSDLKEHLAAERSKGLSIGTVLTMGALHEGHISLVKRSIEETDLTIVSIFVNPKQFNDPADHDLYPRQLEKDIGSLKGLGKIVVFAPEYNEVFSNEEDVVVDLGELDRTMEGSSRPGHFDGVVQVVYRFFNIIKPDVAYFGEKDRQQLLVIKKMVAALNVPVRIQPCPTVRSKEGLALSSRNALLNEEEKQRALLLYRSLSYAADNAYAAQPEDIINKVQEDFSLNTAVELEYFKLIDQDTFQEIKDWNGTENVVAFIAARIGAVRTIDNVFLKK